MQVERLQVGERQVPGSEDALFEFQPPEGVEVVPVE